MTRPMAVAEVQALPAVVDLRTAARALGIGRTLAYQLARTGQFPCPVLKVGNQYRVPTAELLRILGLPPQPAPPEDKQRVANSAATQESSPMAPTPMARTAAAHLQSSAVAPR